MPRRDLLLFTLSVLICAPGVARADDPDALAPANVLRNSRFQDDWLTMLPELKTLSWNYVMDFYHRRDYNPDGWTVQGSWIWQLADLPAGQRRFVLSGPAASATQHVNVWGYHDSAQREGFPDAGGYPKLVAATSPQAAKLLRDVTLRVRLRAADVPEGAATLSAGWAMSPADAAAVMASIAVPAGSYDWRDVELKLPAALWWEHIEKTGGDKTALPALARVTLAYKAEAGRVEIESAELLVAPPATPNVLTGGGFEHDAQAFATGPKSLGIVNWLGPVKYRYFPPGYYYMFGSWHNAPFDNRGFAEADALVVDRGRRSLKMVVAAGDEMAVFCYPIKLNQKEPRLIEVFARVKTEELCMLQIDGEDQTGARLDTFNFIHKEPVSIGSDDWRLIRTVFKPKGPIESLRLKLCARGVNGQVLGGTGMQPQNNVAGIVWWDHVRVYEPESTADELAARGVVVENKGNGGGEGRNAGPRLTALDLGERMLGENLLLAQVHNRGADASLALVWTFTSPTGKTSTFRSESQRIAAGRISQIQVPYTLSEVCPSSYTEYRGTLSLVDDAGKAIAASKLWFGTWTTPIDLEIGGTYLRPEQKQFVRMNLGFASQTRSRAAKVRLEIVRPSTGEVIQQQELLAGPPAIADQRAKIPAGLREDFCNLLLADVDVSKLPLQKFNDPQRHYAIRATLLTADGQSLGAAESARFCRLEHEGPQPAVKSVRIDEQNLLYVNDQPWMPWGVTYGFTPVYDGPADAGEGNYRDLRTLPAFSIYDRHGALRADRKQFDLNCYRYVAGSISPRDRLEALWNDENIYASSAFVTPHPVSSVDELTKAAGGGDMLSAYLAFCRDAPMVVSTAPGIEEAFGQFVPATGEALAGMKAAVDHLRAATNKPVMVGHGGYWNRLEFERVPFFDIYDPETEPFYPAAVHVELAPLVAQQKKAMWLRPQMYENVPYERWRYHVWVEMMRGARGWQMAHGPSDPTTFRGLHAEMEYIKPAAYSRDLGPKVSIESAIEHWSRKHDGKLYIVAATTHGLTSGNWRYQDVTEKVEGPGRRARVTGEPHAQRDESTAGGLIGAEYEGPRMHTIQWLPDAQAWPDDAVLQQWVRLDPDSPPQNLVVLARCDARWTKAASWGAFDIARYRTDLKQAHWFLRAFYRHSSGFMGWDDKLTEKCLQFMPSETLTRGELPKAGEWVQLEIPLKDIKATGVLLDGVGFLHEGGRVAWGQTSIRTADGASREIWGDQIGPPADSLAATKIAVEGLKAGTKIRVAFEDRELIAGEGHFVDDFRGRDLYERYGGGPYTGYGDTPVALHVYEIALP